jgi:hypothetical protein
MPANLRHNYAKTFDVDSRMRGCSRFPQRFCVFLQTKDGGGR